MPDPLFRREVLQSRRRQWLGEVVLDQPTSLRTFSALSLAAALAVGLLLAFGEYTQRIRVSGRLVPTQGMSTLTAPAAGVLERVPVMEGQRVRTGDVLAELAYPRALRDDVDALGATARSLELRREALLELTASQRRRLRQEAAALSEQAALAASESGRLAAELETRRAQLALAGQLLERHRLLRERQYVSELQFQQQVAQALEARALVQSLERQWAAANRQQAQLAQAGRDIPEQLAQLEAQQARDLAALAQEGIELESRAGQVMRAPSGGFVGTLLVHAGQAVQAGQPLMSLLPLEGRLEAHLAVPSRAMGFLKSGDRVLLRYPAYPYQKFGHHGGRVLRISGVAMAPPGAGDAEPVYRVVVALDRQTVPAYGRFEPLRPGAELEADVLGQRRRLWQWVLEPIYSVAGRVQQDGAKGGG